VAGEAAHTYELTSNPRPFVNGLLGVSFMVGGVVGSLVGGRGIAITTLSIAVGVLLIANAARIALRWPTRITVHDYGIVFNALTYDQLVQWSEVESVRGPSRTLRRSHRLETGSASTHHDACHLRKPAPLVGRKRGTALPRPRSRPTEKRKGTGSTPVPTTIDGQAFRLVIDCFRPRQATASDDHEMPAVAANVRRSSHVRRAARTF
jgi:hypothetical protein